MILHVTRADRHPVGVRRGSSNWNLVQLQSSTWYGIWNIPVKNSTCQKHKLTSNKYLRLFVRILSCKLKRCCWGHEQARLLPGQHRIVWRQKLRQLVEKQHKSLESCPKVLSVQLNLTTHCVHVWTNHEYGCNYTLHVCGAAPDWSYSYLSCRHVRNASDNLDHTTFTS